MDGGALEIPGPGSAPDEDTVTFAAELIDRSGKAPVLEAALAHRTGRPRPLPVRAVLTALLYLALDDRPLFLTEVTQLLFCQLTPGAAGCSACPVPPPPSGASRPPTAGSVLLPRDRVHRGPVGAAEKPAADLRRASGPHQAHGPRPGRRGPRSARGAGQRAAGGQRLGPVPDGAPPSARHRPGCHPGAAVLPRPVQARLPIGQRPPQQLVRPRGRPPRTRRRQGHRCASSPGRWKPPSPSPPSRLAPRLRTRTWPSAWP